MTVRRRLAAEAAGLMLADARGNLRVVAASSEDAELMDPIQLQAEQGPCLDCFHTAAPVSVAELIGARERWPVFVDAAVRRGPFASVPTGPPRSSHLNGPSRSGKALTTRGTRLSLASLPRTPGNPVCVLAGRGLVMSEHCARPLRRSGRRSARMVSPLRPAPLDCVRRDCPDADGERAVLWVAGEIDLLTAAAFRVALATALEAGSARCRVVINLVGVTFCSVRGFTLLAEAAEEAAAAGTDYSTVGMSPNLCRYAQALREQRPAVPSQRCTTRPDPPPAWEPGTRVPGQRHQRPLR